MGGGAAEPNAARGNHAGQSAGGKRLMHWKLKALVQNTAATLPPRLSHACYYFLQRRFGNLRVTNPTKRLAAGVKIAERMARQGQSVESKTFLEVGTGHQLNLPIALWLCGASQVTTVDLNPYLQAELVTADLKYMQTHPAEIAAVFGRIAETPIFVGRFSQLAALDTERCTLRDILSLMNIRYLAPVNAARLPIPSASIDCHVSYTVFEHIPAPTLAAILEEGKRLITDTGLFIHCIDCSDHFSHSDRRISSVNFLQFSESEWDRLAGNQYMYQNRLRADDFTALFNQAGLAMADVETIVDTRALEELRQGLVLDERFRRKRVEDNAATWLWTVASNGPMPIQ